MEDINADTKNRLLEILSAGFSDESVARIKKKAEDIVCEIEDELMYRLQYNMAPNLVSFVAEMAKRSVEAILEGNEEQMREYLGCRQGYWTGRSDSPVFGREKDADEWHEVIHGKLFLQGAVKLRHDIVEAHRDLITSERIKDLEDQVNSLVAKIGKLTAEKNERY